MFVAVNAIIIVVAKRKRNGFFCAPYLKLSMEIGCSFCGGVALLGTHRSMSVAFFTKHVYFDQFPTLYERTYNCSCSTAVAFECTYYSLSKCCGIVNAKW